MGKIIHNCIQCEIESENGENIKLAEKTAYINDTKMHLCNEHHEEFVDFVEFTHFLEDYE